MPYFDGLGKPEAPVWVVLERPFDTDKAKGKLLSGGMGYALQKCFYEAGLRPSDLYFTTRRPDTDNPGACLTIDNQAAPYKPPLVCFVGESGAFYLDELRALPGQESFKTQLNKYVGSLLQAPLFTWPHWAMPLHTAEYLMQDYTERNITTFIDLGKVREELEYWKKNKALQPLRERTLLFTEMDDELLLQELDSLRTYSILSEDIETLYPKARSAYYMEHPGIPIVFGIASGPEHAISFCPFRGKKSTTAEVWRALDRLHNGTDCPTIIGQNFFNFDSWYYNMMGLTLPKEKFSDTLIRSHILWPELPRKLQFLTRQYTRQPYYKDEGAGWSFKNMDRLRHYNCLDSALTYEVWLGQEEEFKQRPHLR